MLTEPFAQRALVAALLVGLTCGVLGCYVVLRNMALIGDALSHAVLPGVVVGFWLAGYSVMAFFLGAVGAGLITAWLITLLQRNVSTKPDAVIGIVFTTMFAAGVMGLTALTRKAGVHLDLKDFLFGNVLGVSNDDLLLTGLVAAFTVFSLGLLHRFLLASTLDDTHARISGIATRALHYFLMLVLSFAVVASLQAVGVILVVAMLILPASTALLLTDRFPRMLVLAGVLGMASSGTGLFLALVLDTTPGPAMTLTAAAFYALAVLFSPKQGLLVRPRKAAVAAS